MAKPTCFGCDYRPARTYTSGLCGPCHEAYRKAGFNLSALRRRKDEFLAASVAVIAKQILSGIERDSDDVISQRRKELGIASKYRRAAA